MTRARWFRRAALLVFVTHVAWWPTDALHAQSPDGRVVAARFRLVRCGPRLAAACLVTRLALPPGATLGAAAGAGRPIWSATLGGVSMIGPEQPTVSGASQPDISPAFGAPVLPTSTLGRSSLRGTITLGSSAGPEAAAVSIVRVPATWRPPLLALPAFTGVADSSALPAPVREAIAAGAEPPGVRPLMLLVLVATGGLLVLFVPRFLWTVHRESEEDMARQVAAARALLSTQEFEQLRGRAPRESKPRTAEEATRPVSQQPPSP